MRIQPVRGQNDERLLMVSFEARMSAASVLGDERVDADRALQALDQELKATREELTSSIEELETSNEELKASNEEVRSMYEELQSANEELESSREELQTVNDELNGANRLLEAKIVELAEANDVLTNLLSSADLPTVFLDRELRIQRFTPAARQVLRLLETDHGSPVAVMIERSGDSLLETDARDVLGSLLPISRELVLSDGRWFIRRVHPYRTAEDRIEGLVVTFSGVTRLKRVEEDLRLSEQRYRMIYDNAAVGIAQLDRTGRLRAFNQTLCRITGIPRHVLADHALTDFFEAGPGSGITAAMQRLRAGDGEQREVVELPLRTEGGVRWLRCTLSTGELEGGPGFVLIVEDISDRRATEFQLQERTRDLERSNEDLSQFASMASHDLQAPLRLIGGYLDMIAQLGDEIDQEQRRQYFAIAQTNVGIMRRMITDLLDYARCEMLPERTEPCAAGEAVELALANLRAVIAEHDARIEVGELPRVRASLRLLSQLFQNLIDNALKYRREERPWIRIEAQRDGEAWQFAVSDNGRGIPADQQESIFGLFSRGPNTGIDGTGLGLAICRKGIERLGGRIWCRSEENRGTTFFFTIPDYPTGRTPRD